MCAISSGISNVPNTAEVKDKPQNFNVEKKPELTFETALEPKDLALLESQKGNVPPEGIKFAEDLPVPETAEKKEIKPSEPEKSKDSKIAEYAKDAELPLVSGAAVGAIGAVIGGAIGLIGGVYGAVLGAEIGGAIGLALGTAFGAFAEWINNETRT